MRADEKLTAFAELESAIRACDDFDLDKLARFLQAFVPMKTNIRFFLIILVFLCFGLLPKAQAVNPPPDGGYPNFTTAEGTNALFSLTTGAANTAVGWFSLFSNTDGSFNTAVGAGTLLFNIGDQAAFEGIENTAVGTAALLFNTTGSNNTAVGTTALLNNTIGFQSVAAGVTALYNNTEGNRNVAIGAGALFGNTTGIFNIALGWGAGSNITTGNNNIDIFSNGVAGDDSTIRIGIEGLHTATYIAGIDGATASGGVAVFVNTDGKLGTLTSSARFKDEIKPMDHASEAILALKPITFRYKKEVDPKRIPQFGLVAEEVEKVNPDLVVRDKEGKPYTVRYDAVNAMLLNEFLKARRQIDTQQKQIDALTAGLQKVSAQLEASKPAQQVVSNP